MKYIFIAEVEYFSRLYSATGKENEVNDYLKNIEVDNVLNEEKKEIL